MNPISTYSVVMTDHVHQAAASHLLRKDGQEDLCFGLWRPSTGSKRLSAIVFQLLLPREGERNVHRNVSFEPVFLERALEEASRLGAGLVLLHSHPGGKGWQGMSRDDIRAEQNNAGAVLGVTELPFLGMTLASDGAWSARFWIRTAPRQYIGQWCKSVRVVGESLALTFADCIVPPPPVTNEQTRTVSSWGPQCQSDIARLRIGIVGAGSVGGIVAEAFARTGSTDIVLIDFDTIKPHNLDRLCYATRDDIGKFKVERLAARLREIATAARFNVEPIIGAVQQDKVFQAALDCDVIISCVDRPLGRHVLNFIAYTHLIPVVDGGIAVRTNRHGKLVAADWRAHIVGAGRQCLQCLGQYNPGFVQVERDGMLDDPTYISGLPDGHPLKCRENVYAFSASCASFLVLQLLAFVVAPLDQSNQGAQLYHFVGGFMEPASHGHCSENCHFPSFLGLGNCCNVKVTSP